MLDVLRPGVLDGVTVCAVGGSGGGVVGQRLAGLGADVRPLVADLTDEEAVGEGVARLPHVDAVVVDAGAMFAAGGMGLGGLRAAVDGGFTALRAVANACWIDRDTPGGKVVLVAPAPQAGEHAEAVAAALENTARTLSIEWARHGIRTAAIRPGDATSAEEVAELVAFLASPGGDYVSGSAWSLGTVAAGR